MNHRAGSALMQCCDEGGAIAGIAMDQVQLFARDALDTYERFGMTIAKIVENRNVKARVQQFNAGVRTNITGSAGNKNHGHFFKWKKTKALTIPKLFHPASIC